MRQRPVTVAEFIVAAIILVGILGSRPIKEVA